MKVTFDTNCLVDIELNEGAATELRRLVAAHDSRRIEISVPGISASERMKDGTLAQNFSEFRQRLLRLASREFEILKPPAYFGLAYWDWAIAGDDSTIKLEQRIHEILFPRIAFRWSDHATANGLNPENAAENGHTEWIKWRNRKCDALALWCHIYYGKDVFITRDDNFHKATKKSVLEKLGAKSICYPSEVDT